MKMKRGMNKRMNRNEDSETTKKKTSQTRK